jgi:hypothetical protein
MSTELTVTLEVRDAQHAGRLEAALENAGVAVRRLARADV